MLAQQKLAHMGEQKNITFKHFLGKRYFLAYNEIKVANSVGDLLILLSIVNVSKSV